MASSKKNNEAVEKVAATELPSVPEGYGEVAGDIVGFWDPDLQFMIHVTILNAKVFDGSDKTGNEKPSILLFAKLEDSAVVRAKDENGNDTRIAAEKGCLIGIWGRAGMRQKVFNLAGVDCFICPAGEKDVGKASPMKQFSVRARKMGKPIPLVDDQRDKSRHAPTWWHKDDGSFRTSDEDLDSTPF